MNLLKDTRNPNHQIAGVTNLQEALANSFMKCAKPKFPEVLSKLLFLVVFIFGTEIGFWFS
jgi:hypothetical protein